MRKKYLHNRYGRDSAFWEANWDQPFPATPDVEPKLVRLIERYLKTRSHVLEGGCGNGNYVRYFSAHGHTVTGVDFAASTVDRLRKIFPELDVRKGSVLALDFPDGAFDAYYSGGVIEHFEEGVDGALREAARVLRPGGLFFVTVPHLNLARRISGCWSKEKEITDLDGRQAFLRDRVPLCAAGPAPADYHFHEYEFSTMEMRAFLARYGFRIIDEAAFSALWGIRDLQVYRMAIGAAGGEQSLCGRAINRMLRLTGSIDRLPGAIGAALSGIQSAVFGNMKLYVCRNDGQGASR